MDTAANRQSYTRIRVVVAVKVASFEKNRSLIRLRHTIDVVDVGEVRAIFGTWHKCRPESSTHFPILEAREVDMTKGPTVFESFCKVPTVYVVLINESDENSKVIMPIWCCYQNS